MGASREKLKRLACPTEPGRSSLVKSICESDQECSNYCQPQAEGRPSAAANVRNFARRVNYTATLPKRLVLESSTVCGCFIRGHILLPSHLLHPHHGYLLLQSLDRKHLQSNRSQYFLAVLRECDGSGLYLRLLHCHIQQLPEERLHWLGARGIALSDNDAVYLPTIRVGGDC